MSKHTWLTVPTQNKADLLKLGYDEARKAGATPTQAQTFAGYYCERNMQSGRLNLQHLLKGSIRVGWEICSGRNAENYRLVYVAHEKFWPEELILDLWELVNNDDHDRLMAHGSAGHSALVAPKGDLNEFMVFMKQHLKP